MSAKHAGTAAGPPNRRTPALIVGLVVLALLVFGIGYLLGVRQHLGRRRLDHADESADERRADREPDCDGQRKPERER